MAGRRLAIRSTHWGLLITTAAILVLLNLLGAHWFLRLDLTADKIFTPSSSTRTLLKSLDDNLLVRAYFTRDLPAPLSHVAQALKDLLDEYRSLSGGRVRYEFIDPADKGPGAEQEMSMMGIPMVQVTDVSSDKLQVRNGFMGLQVLFADRSEVIPVIQDTQGLEYLLTSKIRKVTGTGRGKVGVVQGFGSPSLFGDMGQIAQVVRERYELQEVDLEQGEALPSGLSAVLVVDPQVPLSEWALSQLDGYLAGGGGLAVLAGGTHADLQGQVATDLPDRFGGLLADWGVTLDNDLVGDPHNVRITVSQRRGLFTLQNMVDYPYIPLVSDLSPDNPVVSGLESVFLPFVSTVEVRPVEGIHYTELMKSSPESWQGKAPYDVRALIPEGERRIRARAGGPYTVAVAAEGTFPSRYAGRTVNRPQPDGDQSVEVAAPEPAPGRLVVVGSGEFLRDTYMMNGEDVPFLMNGIDWLARDEGLIALRSRGVTDRPLAPVSDPAREAIKAANLVGGALLLVLVGLVRWRLRRGRRRRLEAMP
jgi:gliding-associated putative ABC transporter substrate-binding component GldG